MQKSNKIFEVSDFTKEIFGAMVKYRHADMNYFVSCVETYNNSDYFRPVLKTSDKIVCTGSIPNKLICGGNEGKITYYFSDSFESITIANKKNPNNNYSLKIFIPKEKAELIIESDRYCKSIKFECKKHLFVGRKVDKVVCKVERLDEPYM